MEDKLLKINEVIKILPISRAKLYRLIKKEKLLKQIKIGRSSFWSRDRINKYILKCKNY